MSHHMTQTQPASLWGRRRPSACGGFCWGHQLSRRNYSGARAYKRPFGRGRAARTPCVEPAARDAARETLSGSARELGIDIPPMTDADWRTEIEAA
jgi:hypothetical protein